MMNSENFEKKTISKKLELTIGLPVYNGELFLKQRIESILSQTFSDFKLIISDNASTDSTEIICKEFVKQDDRINYIRQKKNIGIWENFDFVLQQASTEFFVWAAVDDLWLPKFLEENIVILKTRENIVGSISKISTRKVSINEVKLEKIDSFFYNFREKILHSVRSYDCIPLQNTYEKKIKLLLKKAPYMMLYCVFKTNIIKKSMIPKSFVALDVALFLNLLKFGDIHVVEDRLLERFPAGANSEGNISVAKTQNRNKLGLIFPHYPLTVWSIKNLGLKLFFKNIDHYILINTGSEFFLIVDLVRILINKINRN